MEKLQWTQRQFNFDLPTGMLPFYLERLEGTITRLENKIKNLPEEILSKRLDDKWSVKQNIAHLAEVDEISLTRINEILSGVSPISSAVFEPRKDYNSQAKETVLQYFIDNRRKAINRFTSLTDSELQKKSMHPRLKIPITPLGLAWFHAEHDDHHIVRINEIITALS
jgi:uncharacterized damage-inducible protein DinB